MSSAQSVGNALVGGFPVTGWQVRGGVLSKTETWPSRSLETLSLMRLHSTQILKAIKIESEIDRTTPGTCVQVISLVGRLQF